MEIGLTDLNRLYIEAKTKFRMTIEETYTILTVPESIYIYIYMIMRPENVRLHQK